MLSLSLSQLIHLTEPAPWKHNKILPFFITPLGGSNSLVISTSCWYTYTLFLRPLAVCVSVFRITEEKLRECSRDLSQIDFRNRTVSLIFLSLGHKPGSIKALSLSSDDGFLQ